MPFPLLCLGTFFSLFSIISWWYCSAHKKGDGSPFSAPSRGRWQHLSSLVFSDYLRGWFLVSLLCSTMLVLLGAALLFSLPLNFTWSALVLGCFSVLGGLLLLGGHRS